MAEDKLEQAMLDAELSEQRGVTSAKEFWEKNSKIAFEDADFDDIAEFAEAYASSRLAALEMVNDENRRLQSEVRRLHETVEQIKGRLKLRDNEFADAAILYGNALSEIETWKSRAITAESRLAEVSAQLADVRKRLEVWKSRTKKFQDGYNNKSTEATALLIQKLQLEADGATPTLIRQRKHALERARKYIAENATLRAELERLTTENTRLKIKEITADVMAKVADDWVERGQIDSRSALADARLNYGNPYIYESALSQAEAAVARLTGERDALQKDRRGLKALLTHWQKFCYRLSEILNCPSMDGNVEQAVKEQVAALSQAQKIIREVNEIAKEALQKLNP